MCSSSLLKPLELSLLLLRVPGAFLPPFSGVPLACRSSCTLRSKAFAASGKRLRMSSMSSAALARKLANSVTRMAQKCSNCFVSRSCTPSSLSTTCLSISAARLFFSAALALSFADSTSRYTMSRPRGFAELLSPLAGAAPTAGGDRSLLAKEGGLAAPRDDVGEGVRRPLPPAAAARAAVGPPPTPAPTAASAPAPAPGRAARVWLRSTSPNLAISMSRDSRSHLSAATSAVLASRRPAIALSSCAKGLG